MTNILTSHTGKQLLGAVAGMAIAALLYVGIDQTSNIKGLLVSTRTITVTPDSNISDKNADDATLRRIATRAQTVAATLEKENAETQAETQPTNVTSSRRAARQFAVQLAGVEGKKGYTPQTVIQRVEVPVDREVIREVIKEVPVVKEVIKEVPVIREVIKEVPRDVVREVIKEVPKEVIKTVIKEVPVYITTPRSEKGPTPVPYRDLSDSGPGLLMLVGSSAAFALQRVRRRNKISM